MVLPNTLSLSIIAALTMVVNQSFPDLWWSPIALAALVAIGKLLQVNTTTPPVAPQSDFGGPAPEQDSKFKRWIIG